MPVTCYNSAPSEDYYTDPDAAPDYRIDPTTGQPVIVPPRSHEEYGRYWARMSEPEKAAPFEEEV